MRNAFLDTNIPLHHLYTVTVTVEGDSKAAAAVPWLGSEEIFAFQTL